MKAFLIFIIFVTFQMLLPSCGKTPGKTDAKLKLKLAGMVDLTGGIGSGGAILFGRHNNLNKTFGKKISGTEVNLELENGPWTFFAVMWDGSNPSSMNGKVHCGKTNSLLNGTDMMIGLNLNNANCADSEFSEGRKYTDGNNYIRFADLFAEECDVVNATATLDYKCKLDNQGSALSYRFIFQNYRRDAGASIYFEGDIIASDCKTTSALHTGGFPVNFPSGSGSMPLVASIELFLGSNNCSAVDDKGVYRVVLGQGLGRNTSLSKSVTSQESCSIFSFSDTVENNKIKCEDLLRSWNGSCPATPEVMNRFGLAGECSSALTASNMAIKLLISVPTSFLCNRYLGVSAQVGGHPFAGGDGSSIRPYKICTEWQINQIGEAAALPGYLTSSYKLMSDLDMNQTDYTGKYAKPSCVVGSAFLKKHHNFNPLNKIANDCSTVLSSPAGFAGTFNGNYKHIDNARIMAPTVTNIGLVRSLSSTGKIKNLYLNNLEVSGYDYVGGIAGATDGEIKNIRLNNANIEGTGSTFAAGIAAVTTSASIIDNVHLNEGRIKGKDKIAGLVGANYGTITQSHFRGKIKNNGTSTGILIGGLVAGNTTTGVIESSFSEGIIQSSAQYAGGIATNNVGIINNVYSTMVIASTFSTPTVGGLVGNNTGTVSNGFFYGSIKAAASSNTIHTGTVTGTNVYSTNLKGGSVAFSTSTSWNQLSGSIPRLAWENRECLSANNQQLIGDQRIILSRGTQANPFVVCTESTLGDLTNMTTGEYARIAEDIRLDSWTGANIITNLYGTLNGDEAILYGANVSTATSNVGIIKTIESTGQIKNINIYGNSISTSTGTNMGVLAATNDGKMVNISLMENTATGTTHIGLLAGINNGSIYDISIDGGKASGQTNVGGAVGYNTNKMLRIDVDANIYAVSGADLNFGGIVGINCENPGVSVGNIDQVRFAGTVDTSAFALTTGQIGGIVGINCNGASIDNSYTDTYARLITRNADYVGGLVGKNFNSTISTSFALGKVIYHNATTPLPVVETSFQPLVGANPSGTVGSDVFFLKDRIVSWLETKSVSTCASSVCTVATLTASTMNLASINSIPIGSYDFFSISFTNSTQFISATNFSGQSVDFYKAHSLGTSGLTAAAVNTAATFPTTYDMVGEGDADDYRLYDYYTSYFNKTDPPSYSPIWEFDPDSNEGHPTLLQLQRR